MSKNMAKTMRKKERGMALLLTLFALLLLSGVGLFMVVSSNTETRIDANYGSSLKAYYGARSGIEEVRDRIKYPSSDVPGGLPGGLANQLPQDIVGNPKGVLYVLNPAPGETVDPTDLTSPYFDDDLCHNYNSGTPKGIKCTTVPVTSNWQLPPQFSLAPAGQLNYKWIRINIKTNRSVVPSFCVDQQQDCSAAPLDTRVCWDGKAEQLSPGGANPSCDANGMQTVYMLTSLAVTRGAIGPNGARKLLQIEVVAPSIRPAGALTAASMTVTASTAAGIPPVAVDGRVHKLDGSLAVGSSCSAVSALATDTGSTQLEQALNQMRKSIVDTANSSCNLDGTSIGSNFCSPGLWWVRGTDLNTRFVTTISTSSSSGSGSGHDGGDDDDHVSTTTVACGSTTTNCSTNLNLAAPQLFGTAATTAPHIPTVALPLNATSPFVGGSGNQVDNTIYQPGAKQSVADQIAAVNNLVSANVTQANYFTPTATTLASSYGSSTSPAIVVFSDPILSLQAGATLTGYGVLVVPSALEISGGTLNWTGIVLINSSAGHVTINSGASGSINGALLLAPGAGFNLANSQSATPSFHINYSCDAIDLAFTMQPFKVISTAETSF